ncbi:MAG: LamG-like jellyroll fold domain-containing protein [Chitinophagaceae bacterium]|nr:LamG-like jellyroll fold domain-containing protein [Chitinophagaceae bacterium]
MFTTQTIRIYLTALLFIFFVISCKKDKSGPPIPPEVQTVSVNDITESSAKLSGQLVKTGSGLVSDYGFCWAKTQNPTTTNNIISNGSTNAPLIFQHLLLSLDEEQTYYFRSFAINRAGTSYGAELSFKTLGSPLKNGLVAYYPFNGNTNDESGNNNHGVAAGGSLANDKTGKANSAYYFGGSDYIKVLNSASLSGIGNAFSVSGWINNEGQGVSLICKSPFNGTAMQFRVYADTKILFANNKKAADFDHTLNPANTWKHIVIVSDGNNAKYYLNGTLVSTITLTSSANTDNISSDMFIGVDTHGTSEYYKGRLDEIRIYSRVLNDNEVLSLFNR